MRLVLPEGAALPTGFERSLVFLGDEQGELSPEPARRGTVQLPPDAVQSLAETLRLESGSWLVSYRSADGLQGEVRLLLDDERPVQVARVALAE